MTDKPLPHGNRTRCVHSGIAMDKTTGAVTQPIHLSTIFEHPPEDAPDRPRYTRMGNPNRHALEVAVAELENAAASVAFGSGTAAIAAVFSMLPVGKHVLVPQDMYFGTRSTLKQLFHDRLDIEEVDMTNVDFVRSRVRAETAMLWVETPSNPCLRISDLATLAEVAHEAGAIMTADNTFATPLLQSPFELGADLIMHSATKYIGGHSDVLLGLIVIPQEGELLDRIRQIQIAGGGVPSPHDCWLARRGLMTMPLRMAQHCKNAKAIAGWLIGRPEVERVFYPGLPDHPGHELAARQMRDFGGVVSFLVAAGEAVAKDIARRTHIIANATSLGGVESLMEHRASAEGPESTTERNLLRFSVGIENVEDLIADLEQAFKAAHK
ncbi:PLP-dependent transferase [bacterium]|nr:PLP-dependent transferase [bacterium]